MLLNGLGSDELLGGYGRHRTAFKAAGWQAVIDEVRTIMLITYDANEIDSACSSNSRSTAFQREISAETTA